MNKKINAAEFLQAYIGKSLTIDDLQDITEYINYAIETSNNADIPIETRKKIEYAALYEFLEGFTTSYCGCSNCIVVEQLHREISGVKL